MSGETSQTLDRALRLLALLAEPGPHQGAAGGHEPGPAAPGGQRQGPAEPGARRQGPAEPGARRQGPAEPGGQKQGTAGPRGRRHGPAEPGGQKQGPAEPGGHKQGAAGPGGQRQGLGRSVTDLAVHLGISRPAVYRLLTTLELHGMVTRGTDGQVRLGLGLLPLAQAVNPRLEQVAAPLLRLLAEEMGATAHLTVAEPGSAGEAVAVAVVEPSHTDLHVAYRVGSRHPLGRGAAGRAILAARHGDGERFVVSEGELQAGALGIAAPVLGVAGLEASVGLVTIGPAGGPGSLDPGRAGPRVVATAAALATALRVGEN